MPRTGRVESLSPEKLAAVLRRKVAKVERGLATLEGLESFLRAEQQLLRNEVFRDFAVVLRSEVEGPRDVAALQGAHARGGWNAVADEAGRQLRALCAQVALDQVEQLDRHADDGDGE